VLFSGCGGGGDSGATTTSFPAQAGFRARIAAGSTDNFTLSGTCTGTATITNGAPTDSTFEGVPGFAATQTATATVNLTNCTPETNVISGTSYYDRSYTPLGSSIPGVEYAKFQPGPPLPLLPLAVKVGDTADYATLTTFTDSTKIIVTGQRVLSYVVEADTANTAVVNLVSKGYDMLHQPLFTQQSRYRIAADGTLTVLTIDVQYSTTSTTHLLYTKV
jgi:hypothetical protein